MTWHVTQAVGGGVVVVMCEVSYVAMQRLMLK